MRDWDIEAPWITRAERWGMEDDYFCVAFFWDEDEREEVDDDETHDF